MCKHEALRSQPIWNLRHQAEEFDHDPKSKGSTRVCQNQTCALKDRVGRLKAVPQKETLKSGSQSGQRRPALCPPKVLMTSCVSSQQLSEPQAAGMDPGLQGWTPACSGGLCKRDGRPQAWRRGSGAFRTGGGVVRSGSRLPGSLHPASICLSSPPSAEWPLLLPLHLRHAP